VNDRNFPMFGAAMLCMAGFALFLGIGGVLKSMGVSGVTQLFPKIAAVMLVPAFLFGFVAQAIFSLARPKFLIPPGQREESG
jgi:energy-coupling factor transporter transmembrane protein EcfT